MNVALRVLCSQGWLNQIVDIEGDEITFSTNTQSAKAFALFPLYKDVYELLKITAKYHPRKFEAEPFRVLERVFADFVAGNELAPSNDELTNRIRVQVFRHIEGIILGPTLVHLGMGGMFHKYFMQASFKPEEFHKDPESFKRLLDILVHFDWFQKKTETYRFTEKGLFFAKRAAAYGVTVSYIPTLRNLDELIFGNPNAARAGATETEESHVDRGMNVWGSGGAHSAYFKVVDEIVIDLFNRPINEQPKGILDMGCGNGAFLMHLFQVIEQNTLRGQMLEEHPLILVGADYNEAAMSITRRNLIQADIWAKVVWGDIGRPDLLAENLQEDYDVELSDLLNVRTFLDHNRIWKAPEKVDSSRNSESTGAFAFRGERLNNSRVEESLLEHFTNWQPYVKKFGLLLIELHTVKPELVAANLGKTAATAYDATHGFSDQYIVEIDVFNKVLAESGLMADKKLSKKFPNSDLATVSVNLFKSES